MRKFILIILALVSHALQAQDITTATVSWTVIKTQVINTGETIESEDLVVSNGRNIVEWKDSRGVVKKSFIVSEVNGTWSNVQAPGTCLYEAQCGDKLGTITFQRTTSGIIIRILLLNDEEIPDIYEMTVSTITVQ